MAGWYRKSRNGFTIRRGWTSYTERRFVQPARAMPRPDIEPDRNPQARQMADESMVRNLAAQALAIWPQESRLFRRYRLPAAARIADIGCGTGEITARLAEYLPQATLLGVDIYSSHIEHASRRYRASGDRLQFVTGDAFALDLPADAFDLTVCRHLLQAVPFPERVIGELVRITKPGGWLHLLAEDYGLIHFYPTRLDCDPFWREVITLLGGGTQTDLRIGRRAYTLLKEAGCKNISVDYITVDTLRVSREICASIIEAWRDGYTDVLAEYTHYSQTEVLAYFNDMIACIRHPRGYAAWQVPIIAGQV